MPYQRRQATDVFVPLLLISLALFPSVGCQSFQPTLRNPFNRHKISQADQVRQWNKGGIEALQNGRLDQAKSMFNKAASENPNDEFSHLNLARTLKQEGDMPNAIQHMQRASEIAGNNDPRLIVELGEMYLASGQWLPAKRQAELALELDHRFAPAWALKGTTSLAKGDYDSALADFQCAAGIDGNLPGIQLSIVQTYQRLNQPLRALSAVEQLLSRYPPDQQPESALIAKSVALVELKQLSPAIEVLTRASERESVSAEVFLRLGQAQLLAGQASQARLTLTLAKQAFPQQPEFETLLAQLQSDQTSVASLDLPQRR
jgi:tetratricopeptide (TPR) repeat protein